MASEADVVLLKVCGNQDIHNEDIMRGVEWAVAFTQPPSSPSVSNMRPALSFD